MQVEKQRLSGPIFGPPQLVPAEWLLARKDLILSWMPARENIPTLLLLCSLVPMKLTACALSPVFHCPATPSDKLAVVASISARRGRILRRNSGAVAIDYGKSR